MLNDDQKLERLKKRADFLRASRARKVVTSGFILQIRNRGDTGTPRVGFTCSKKVGNAVARNRAKRRLRALAQNVLRERASAGFDYVLIGRANETVSLSFTRLEQDLSNALDQLK